MEKEWKPNDPSFLTLLKESIISIDWDDEAGAHLASLKQSDTLFLDYWALLKALNALLKGTHYYLSDEGLKVHAQLNIAEPYCAYLKDKQVSPALTCSQWAQKAMEHDSAFCAWDSLQKASAKVHFNALIKDLKAKCSPLSSASTFNSKTHGTKLPSNMSSSSSQNSSSPYYCMNTRAASSVMTSI
uniref:Uncharacterized protein n=1 Tax=Moniliophthora roreri TaxID=221103 RepID=A0A0W0FX99_MONRR